MKEEINKNWLFKWSFKGKEILYNENNKLFFNHLKDSEWFEYIWCNIDKEVVKPYLYDLQEYLGREEYNIYINNQINRDLNEYHTTLIGPAELKKLWFIPNINTDIYIKDIKILWLWTCNKEWNTAYFIVVKSDLLNQQRKNLWLEYKDFHITLWFNKEDVFWIPKDETSLLKK